MAAVEAGVLSASSAVLPQGLAVPPAAAAAPALAASGVPQDLVFVDLETTGGNAAFHRITEVGIVRMEGGVVVEEWSSLINPECRIPAYIEAFTGISNEMVAGAPRFADAAALILEKLRSPIFVAHNARFDYSFLRTEFQRLDVRFSAKVLCTVKLSRRLFPEFPRHSLDAVMARHGLRCAARHRALGDARVLADFWCKLVLETAPQTLAAAAAGVIGAHRLPPHLPPELADELPEGPGVYRFFGEDDALLYIGRSVALRPRILAHFAAEHGDAKEQRKAQQTRRIDWLETAGELGAQLTEAQWIKTQRPRFNQRRKAHADPVTLRACAPGSGVEFESFADLAGGSLDECFGVFHTPKDGRKALMEIARAHGLCLKVLGLEQSEGSCFAHQVGKCKGACVGKESILLHDTRLRLALSALKLKSWPFPGRIALKEGSAEYHVLDRWMYLGTARCDEELAALAAVEGAAPVVFDLDVYRILVRYLAKHPRIDWVDLRADRS